MTAFSGFMILNNNQFNIRKEIGGIHESIFNT